MKSIHAFGRLLVPASLLLLAACQSMPGKSTQTAAAPATSSTAPAAQAPAPQERQPAAEQGAPVAVFLADTQSQAGWTPINVQGGTLYVNPQPVVTRDDLSGIQAGTSKQGEGLLALELNEAGKRRVADLTTRNPNKRLALVVGKTMMAAPGYSSPVTTGRLVFAVGTEQNAMAAARAIAGVDAGNGQAGTGGAATTPSTSGTPSSMPRTAPSTGSTGARSGAQ